MFTLALAGRPNVGKSTLYNRLAGKKLAIVHDQPGVTRDWREAEAYIYDHKINILDTAGLEEAPETTIPGRMRQQTEAALERADVILFIVDGREGLTPVDHHFATFLRKQKKPIILAVNKCENETVAQNAVAEAWELGLGDPIPVSAEHNHGVSMLFDAILPHIPEEAEEEEFEERGDDNLPDDLDDLEGQTDYELAEDPEDVQDLPIKIAIAGRPNVGKSTLMNTILGEQRSMTGPEAGITRDTVTAYWEFNGHKFRLVDTAGLRRKARITENLERMSVQESLRAIRLAQVVILMIDTTQRMSKQDLQIASHVIREGRAIVIAANKWDSVDDKNKVLEQLREDLEHSLAQIKDIPLVTLSALKGRNIDKLMNKVVDTYQLWNKRVQTGPLNRWLDMMESHHPAPLVGGKRNRLKFMAQIKSKPPTFALWASRPDDLPESYRRYLVNGIREDFDLPAVPVRLILRKSKNPYA